VIYILKENRTYDQILGDLPVGDGDKSLTMYGADITPTSTNWRCNSECSTTSTTAEKFPATDTSGPLPRPRRLQRENLADRLSQQGTYLRFWRSVADEFPLEQGIPDVDDPEQLPLGQPCKA